ncbi:MAG: endopeptidase La [Bacteroidales bacterium]|nr:endopeptidase La [Bacteroidales bacterium]NLO42545.1 endopeptidase La [Bacteroidales bacterium]
MTRRKLDKEHTLQDILSGEADIIPLLNPTDLEEIKTYEIPEEIPILPLRNTVMFPGIMIPITVGREKSIDLVNESYRNKTLIGVITQRDEDIQDPEGEDLFQIGTLSRILKIYRMLDGGTTIIIQGIKLFKMEQIVAKLPYLRAKVSAYDTNDSNKKVLANKEFKATMASLTDVTDKCLKLSPNHMPPEVVFMLKNIGHPSYLIHFIASNLDIEVIEKQQILENTDITLRAKMVLHKQLKCLQMEELKAHIQSKAKTELDKQQKEYLLNQQLKVIQDELGNNSIDQTVKELKAKAEKKKWDDKTQKQFEKEIAKLERMNQMSPDFTVHLNYLELLVDLPWNEFTETNIDLHKARKILDEDHYGLEKIKDRIVEYLAVLKLKGDMKAPILCFVGPPGVGKTSLGKSVARATGRKYIRMSLGGLHDESEIRGHRKTYIGAMPGRIIQSIRKAESANPIFVLDEIDKISGATPQGDPSSAMLEVLDPEQNNAFYDNFLETTFDLSKILFIATANSLNNIHPALVDRMEIIDLSSYLLEEKIEIAKRHLIPRQIAEHGITKKQIHFSDNVIQQIISDYTREAGVRILEKNIAKVIRHQAFLIASNENYTQKLSKEHIEKILGSPLYKKENDLKHNKVGIAIGLAWTPVGGDILYIETAISEGKGNLSITGNLGDVMKESATIAYEYVKAHAADFGIDPSQFEKKDVYIHVPEGAIPKDGPSAGIALLTAIISTFTGVKPKPRLAMTGEITLRGKLSPVGGIKEKILAAKRANIHDIVLPIDNQNNVQEIDAKYIEGLQFHYFDDMTQALRFNLQF